MKKLLIPVMGLVLAGCAGSNLSIDKEIKQTQIENKIISKYQISKNSLVKSQGNYYFYEPVGDGITVTELDKNYNVKKQIKIPKLIDVTRIKAGKNSIYILGYDQQKNRPIIIKISDDLNKISYTYTGYEYDVPKDMVINKKPVVVLIHYQNGAKLEICEGNKCKTYKSKNNTLVKFIKKYNGGYLVTGSVQSPKEDLFIAFIKNGKIVWSKVYDFGMSDTPLKVTIKNKNAIINLVSQDYMGAEKYITITIDENGNIIKKKNGVEFKQLPTRFRT
ncbi:hypothetical protein [Caminibacter sp.]